MAERGGEGPMSGSSVFWGLCWGGRAEATKRRSRRRSVFFLRRGTGLNFLESALLVSILVAERGDVMRLGSSAKARRLESAIARGPRESGMRSKLSSFKGKVDSETFITFFSGRRRCRRGVERKKEEKKK